MKSVAPEDYRMPAEWEPHEATWLNWPNFSSVSFPVGFQEALDEMLEMVRILTEGEKVFINVTGIEEETWIRSRLGVEQNAQVECFEIPSREPWCRDTGPTFVRSKSGQRAAVSWRFNAWGERFKPWALDDAVAARMAEAINLPSFRAAITLEGGGLETDGEGTLLCTESCILEPHRNPGMTRAEAEAIFRRYLGVTKVLWLPSGMLEDETDGHIDTFARFVAPGHIVAVGGALRPEYDDGTLGRNVGWLRQQEDAQGCPIQVTELPLAEAFTCMDRETPVTHANFHMGNQHVLVPQYGGPGDDAALGILREIITDREVISQRSRFIPIGLGGIHCLTQQLPAASVPARS